MLGTPVQVSDTPNRDGSGTSRSGSGALRCEREVGDIARIQPDPEWLVPAADFGGCMPIPDFSHLDLNRCGLVCLLLALVCLAPSLVRETLTLACLKLILVCPTLTMI